MTKLVLVRHGQSVWNEKNLFTGWTDVGLTEQGREEARKGARALLEAGLSFDVCYTSLLKRAIHTLWLVLEEMDRMWLPVHKTWRLNERHYGALQGLDKAEMAERVGKEQVHVWRRSYDVPPPALEITDERFPGYDPRYAHLDIEHLPRTECLKDTVERVLPYWQDEIAPAIKRGCRVLISAHGNSLRGMMKYLEGISDEDIPGVEIPTGVPRVYELDQRLRPERAYYLDGEGG